MKQGLQQYELYRLLKTIKFRQASGILQVTAPTGRFDIYLKEGFVIYIHTAQPDRSLSAFLLKAGLIDKNVLGKVIEQSRKTNESFDKVAQNLHVFAPGTLEKAKISHQNTLFAFVLSLEKLEVELKEKPLPAALKDIKPMDALPAICRAVVASNNLENMRFELESLLGQGLQVAPEAFNILPLIKTFIGEHDILYWIRQGDLKKITPKTLEDETALRIMIVLYLDDHFSGPRIDLPHEHDEILSALNGQLSKMLRMNYYEMLGVTIESPLSVVDSRYNALKRRFSATRFENTPYQDKVEELIRQIHEMLDKSKEALMDKTRRLDYNRLLKLDNPGLNTRLESMFNAQEIFMAGIKSFDSGALRDAESMFNQAVNEFPDDPLYTVFLARVRLLSYGNNNPKLEEIGEILKTALSKDPENPEILYTFAQFANKNGRQEEAINYTKRVLNLDPGHQNARALFKVFTSRNYDPVYTKKDTKISWKRIFDKIKSGKNGGKNE